MNERIKELINESTCFKEGDTEGKYDIEVFDKEKFAELIVRECANIVWDEAEMTMSSEVNDAGYKIIEYFGVEE